VYWGITVGLSNVNYKGYSEYTEGLRLVDGTDAGTVTLADERRISGTGFGLKGGVIIRPVEQLPLRFGLSVATPTWYDLKSENQTQLFNNSSQGSYDEGHNAERYDFKYYTDYVSTLMIFEPVPVALTLDYGGATHHIIIRLGNNWRNYLFQPEHWTQQRPLLSAQWQLVFEFMAIYDGDRLVQEFDYGNYDAYGMFVVFKIDDANDQP
jgi:hypothetical protein